MKKKIAVLLGLALIVAVRVRELANALGRDKNGRLTAAGVCPNLTTPAVRRHNTPNTGRTTIRGGNVGITRLPRTGKPLAASVVYRVVVACCMSKER